MRQGTALVISAPSGTGKSTLSSMLLGEFPNLGYSISCTTRSPRQGEVHGSDYYFLTREEFEKKRAEREFAEWANVHENLYGTLLKPVNEMLAAGRDVLFDIDVQGAHQLKQTLPGAVFIFILPPSMKELENRLHKRGVDDVETIARRMVNARREIGEARWYDKIILNDELERAYERLRSVYMASTLAVSRNMHMIEKILES